MTGIHGSSSAEITFKNLKSSEIEIRNLQSRPGRAFRIPRRTPPPSPGHNIEEGGRRTAAGKAIANSNDAAIRNARSWSSDVRGACVLQLMSLAVASWGGAGAGGSHEGPRGVVGGVQGLT